MVSTLAPCALNAGKMQLFTGVPSTSTVQMPHSASLQPIRVPVSPRSSRSTADR